MPWLAAIAYGIGTGFLPYSTTTGNLDLSLRVLVVRTSPIITRCWSDGQLEMTGGPPRMLLDADGTRHSISLARLSREEERQHILSPLGLHVAHVVWGTQEC